MPGRSNAIGFVRVELREARPPRRPRLKRNKPCCVKAISEKDNFVVSASYIRNINWRDRLMTSRKLLALGAAAVALSAQPGLASPCSADIDRAWVQLNAQIQARVGAGRSAPQSTIAMMHRQPTQSSIAAAEETLVDVWLPMETAVSALARARGADRANDRTACEAALKDVQRLIGR